MKTPEIIAMSIFALLVVIGLIAGIRQSAQRRAQTARFAALRGATVLNRHHERLRAYLEAMMPEESWVPKDVIQMEGGEETLYLFGYQSNRKNSRSSPSYGTACLAAHSGRVYARPVSITTRVPGLDRLAGGRVAVGSEEFRRKFTVTCERDEDAAAVNAEVERVLLEHDAAPGWHLSVLIAGRQVIASSRWAESEKDWDHLVTLVKRLRAALR